MPLQKSFSDQNHSANQKTSRRTWSKSKTHVGHHHGAPQASSKPLQEKPPFPVSTSTKNKLSAFQFTSVDSTFDSKAKSKSGNDVINLVSSDNGQENQQVAPNRPSKTPVRKPHIDMEAESNVLPELKASDVPVTPAGRLALLDLVGMGDATVTEQDVSPEERLLWDHNKDIIHSSASNYGGARRVRKRARSSSPVGSSPATISRKKFETQKTPVDPGSDLWGRFSLIGSASHNSHAQNTSFQSNMLYTSSPQPNKEVTTPRSLAGFRRANSCGNQFPKRRRIGHTDDVFTDSPVAGPSKLSVLIERVQEHLTQPSKSTTPSGSLNSYSPSLIGIPASPEEGDSRLDIQDPMKPAAATVSSNPYHAQDAIVRVSGHRTAASSDYGDDDMDESLLDVVNDQSAQPILSTNHADARMDQPHPITNSNTHTTSPKSSIRRNAAVQPPIFEDDDDEFDDSDVEMFAADLEVLASKYDTPSVSGQTLQGQQKSQHISTDSCGAVAGVQANVIDDSDDEFGSDGLDDSDLAAAELSATQSIQQSTSGLLPSTPKSQAIQRYLVTNVLNSEYASKSGKTCREKVLHLQLEGKKNNPKAVFLRGTWLETPVNAKAYVHVIGTFDNRGRCVIDDDNNILILHPDHLISSTVVGDSFGCTRRAVLQDRVKATGEASAPMLYGTILHEIFQAALLANRWDLDWLGETVQTITANHLEDLYTIHLPVTDAVEYLMGKMTELQSWAELFVSAQPQPGAIVQAGNGVKASMCVSKLLDVEEHVWSPMYGLKGNIDATVQVTMKDGDKSRTLTVPFEVKTGKNPTPAHRAQTALYNLLISDRYDVEIAYGILYYMETSETIRIPSIRRELIHMIMQRNELACFVRERHAQLPPMLKKENMCNRCYAKVPCFIYHRLADDGTGETSGLKTKFDDVVKHLTPKHKEFFLKWDDLLTKEEKESMKFRRELWTMLSTEREKKGSCFSNVIIEQGSAAEDRSKSKINRYKYNMIKRDASPEFSFLESQIVVGDPIVISDEQGHYALACGYVTHLRKARITVAVDRRLHNSRIRQPGFDEHDNQVFASIMDVTSDNAIKVEHESKIPVEPVTFRLDKDEFSNGMATARNNIIQVMSHGPFGSQKIRGLVVDLNAPREKHKATSYVLKDRDSLNIDQRRAIKKVMQSEDYALILGMPGTGKTTTIAHIIRAIVGQGKSVLLTSYTHSAVDNILLKLKNDNIPILRLGTASKIHPDVQEFATLAVTPKDSFDEIKTAWHGSPVVGTTCLGINHPIFNERVFDYCIVDEASQITLPVCLGPIRLAQTFILVGDHYQLPPLVQNEEARIGGLDISLFKHLSDNHPNSVVYLEHQYRMCEDVMALSNNLIYSGRLKCGSQAVAQSSITIPDIAALSHHHFTPSTLTKSQKSICLEAVRGRCWLRDMVDPGTKVSFLNTDPLLPLSREEAKGNRIVNPTEAIICTQLVEALLTVGIKAEDIGVMTHYRSQLARLKDGLRHRSDVEMHTTDRFQGRDKEVIILSLVRSNEQHSIGELLKDWRRINVAFTRAKTKLLVIGSRETLLGNGPNTNGGEEMVARFVKLMEEKRWIYNLAKNALEEHYFDDNATQLTCTMKSPYKPIQVEKIKFEKVAKPQQSRLIFATESKVEDKENADAGGDKGLQSRRAIVHAGLGVKKQPAKKVFGNKPFKMPHMSVMKDIFNENL